MSGHILDQNGQNRFEYYRPFWVAVEMGLSTSSKKQFPRYYDYTHSMSMTNRRPMCSMNQILFSSPLNVMNNPRIDLRVLTYFGVGARITNHMHIFLSCPLD